MRKALIAASALALALTVSACGDEAKKGSPIGQPPVSAPADNTGLFNDAQSLVDAAKEGAAKAKTSKFTMDMTIGSMMSMKAEGQAEYAGTDTKMAMTMNMDMSGVPGAGGQGNMAIEMILLDRNIYMKMPQGMGGSAEKPWIKMSLDQMGGGGAQMEQSMQFSDPTKTLEMIQENGEILNTEQTTVDGQPATKYSVELDAAKLMEKMGQQMPGNVKIDKLPMDVYLNADNLPVQIEMDMGKMMKDIAEQSGQPMPSGMDSAKMTAKYTNWGEPVDIKAPPADQVNEGGLPGMPGGSTPPSTPN